MNTTTVSIQLLACLLSAFSGLIMLFIPGHFPKLRQFVPKSRPQQIVQGILHCIAGILTLLGIFIPFIAFFASCFVLVTSIPLMVRANQGSPRYSLILGVILFTASISVALLQPLGLKVLALPKADELPFKAVAWKVVKAYDEGFWFEGIAVDNDGSLYLSGNRDLDFAQEDYYHNAIGKLIKRKPDGSEKVIFNTPRGMTSGVPLVLPDNSVYLTSHGAISYVWQIDSVGNASQLATFPKGAWPNGLDVGPDGMLYSVDSSLGLIWRIDPKSGDVKEMMHDSALLARRFIALAPGANGIHFSGRDFFVSVSDQTTVLRYTLDTNGEIHFLKKVSSGIPGDDFAIGKDNSIFVTTHPYNTVIRIAPDGERTIIAGIAQQIVGPTDAAFGKNSWDNQILYVVTDGGAFTGGPKTRGMLIALEPYR